LVAFVSCLKPFAAIAFTRGPAIQADPDLALFSYSVQTIMRMSFFSNYVADIDKSSVSTQ